MCKHVAAVLYGIGARLDEQPELLFRLREVDEKDLIAHAGTDVPLTKKGPAAEKLLVAEGLADIFGLDMAEDVSQSVDSTAPARPGKRPSAPGRRAEAGRRGHTGQGARSNPPLAGRTRSRRRRRGRLPNHSDLFGECRCSETLAMTRQHKVPFCLRKIPSADDPLCRGPRQRKTPSVRSVRNFREGHR